MRLSIPNQVSQPLKDKIIICVPPGCGKLVEEWYWLFASRENPAILGLYSLSGATSYRKISRSLEAATYEFKHFQLLWYLTDISAAPLSDMPVKRQSDAIIIRPNLVASSLGGKTSYRLVTGGPGKMFLLCSSKMDWLMYAVVCSFRNFMWLADLYSRCGDLTSKYLIQAVWQTASNWLPRSVVKSKYSME